MKKFVVVEGSICAPKGFFASGVYSGVKKSKRKDLGILFSTSLASCAGVFTTNKVKAAPLIVSKNVVGRGFAQAIVINSGNANACTGEKGLNDALQMQKETAKALKINQENVLVASTGIIGEFLPMKNIVSGIWTASRMINRNGFSDFAEAILTTDLVKKEISIRVNLSNKKSITIGGVAKGSGMICPNMATMIAVITTDAFLNPKMLQKALNIAVEESFNMVTVDNDTSTNDCVFVLANGQSEKVVSKKDYEIFVEALTFVCQFLAKEIAKDGEGATKLVEVRVVNAKTKQDAQIVAKTIVGSNLFKCAIYGADPNFGRILAAIGYSGANINPSKIDVWLKKMLLVKNGLPIKFDKQKASLLMREKNVEFMIDLKSGKFSSTAWGCDLTEKYIDINARYHT